MTGDKGGGRNLTTAAVRFHPSDIRSARIRPQSPRLLPIPVSLVSIRLSVQLEAGCENQTPLGNAHSNVRQCRKVWLLWCSLLA